MVGIVACIAAVGGAGGNRVGTAAQNAAVRSRSDTRRAHHRPVRRLDPAEQPGQHHDDGQQTNQAERHTEDAEVRDFVLLSRFLGHLALHLECAGPLVQRSGLRLVEPQAP